MTKKEIIQKCEGACERIRTHHVPTPKGTREIVEYIFASGATVRVEDECFDIFNPNRNDGRVFSFYADECEQFLVLAGVVQVRAKQWLFA